MTITLSKPTPALIAVSMLLSARKEIRSHGNGSQNIIGRAIWAVIDELDGDELAFATMLVNIDNERTQASLTSLLLSSW